MIRRTAAKVTVNTMAETMMISIRTRTVAATATKTSVDSMMTSMRGKIVHVINSAKIMMR